MSPSLWEIRLSGCVRRGHLDHLSRGEELGGRSITSWCHSLVRVFGLGCLPTSVCISLSLTRVMFSCLSLPSTLYEEQSRCIDIIYCTVHVTSDNRSIEYTHSRHEVLP